MYTSPHYLIFMQTYRAPFVCRSVSTRADLGYLDKDDADSLFGLACMYVQHSSVSQFTTFSGGGILLHHKRWQRALSAVSIAFAVFLWRTISLSPIVITTLWNDDHNRAHTQRSRGGKRAVKAPLFVLLRFPRYIWNILHSHTSILCKFPTAGIHAWKNCPPGPALSHTTSQRRSLSSGMANFHIIDFVEGTHMHV